MKREIIKARNSIINTIRTYFNSTGYLEVETPVLSPYLIPESTIDVFETTYLSETSDPLPLYLTPSPEIFMKKLIAEGYGNIYQITKSFRNYEQKGKHHNPEFTMLEWYTVDADAADNIQVTEELFGILADKADRIMPDTGINLDTLKPPFLKVSMEEIFFEKSGIDLSSCRSFHELKEAALKKGYFIPGSGETWETVFNRIFLTEVEPFLPSESPVVIYNYPAEIECLAKNIPGTPWKDRWELYIGSTEIANCYTEETDRRQIASVMKSEYEKKSKIAKTVPPIDPDFTRMFDGYYPECSGVALGIDRLVALLTGTPSIGGVILFPFSDILGG